MKKCPYCAEEIQDEAVKCKHCQSLVNEKNNTVEVDKSNQKGKSKAIPVVLATFSVALILGTLNSPNFGFSPVEIGRDIWALLVYGLGARLIYDAVKVFRKK